MEKLEGTMFEADELRFVAYEAGNHTNIVAQGNDADSVLKEAENSGADYIFCFIPDKDATYIL